MDDSSGLFGSSILPPLIHIDGEQVQLGVIVCRTHRESGLTFKEWNDLPCLDREARLAATIYAMREEKEKARAR